ncbi:Phosphopantothenoylcysteine decarboxylase [Pirellulimonas nuda]|uniref:Phosphopantothenoylcysteine decarboxylase n=1 Tax=Pirellulimonas nuda TaxID=2528009 RepID=A0A518DGR3_9BACT|nr:flavoprotein [Pirellulimonas nuda]QDU90665.1 Phosphopantothenoylcysteine decarboxylase [Pirellulimonas nuda]
MPAEVVIGVCGGVSAYKTAAVVSRLAQDGYGVSVVMTRAARRFVGPATFAALSGRRVVQGLFDQADHPLGPHIELARSADLLCIAPATAGLLSQAAAGAADDLLSTLLLSFTGPILLAPAMNVEMWQKAAVQRNVERVREDGLHIISPGRGWQSCREVGPGRMAEPDEIVAAIQAAIRGKT